MSDNTPPSQMLRVPSALVDAVKELSRLHRSGYTSAVLTGLQQLIASIDSTADSVASVAGGKSDTELLAELIAGLDERIAAQVAVQVAQLEQRMAKQLEEQTREGQENYKQWLNEACKLGRELERSKQQSPSSIESEPPVASSPPAAKRKVQPRASKSSTSGKKPPGFVKKLVEENLTRGKQLPAMDLAPLIGVSDTAIRDRRRAEEQGKAGKLAEWGLKFVPGSDPHLYERI